MTVLQVVQKKYPKAVENWDHWDYKISSPLSLDDLAMVCVILKNKDKSFTACEIPLVGFVPE